MHQVILRRSKVKDNFSGVGLLKRGRTSESLKEGVLKHRMWGTTTGASGLVHRQWAWEFAFLTSFLAMTVQTHSLRTIGTGATPTPATLGSLPEMQNQKPLFRSNESESASKKIPQGSVSLSKFGKWSRVSVTFFALGSVQGRGGRGSGKLQDRPRF